MNIGFILIILINPVTILSVYPNNIIFLTELLISYLLLLAYSLLLFLTLRRIRTTTDFLYLNQAFDNNSIKRFKLNILYIKKVLDLEDIKNINKINNYMFILHSFYSILLTLQIKEETLPIIILYEIINMIYFIIIKYINESNYTNYKSILENIDFLERDFYEN